MIRKYIFTFLGLSAIASLIALSACSQPSANGGNAAGGNASSSNATSTGKAIASAKSGDLTVTLSNPAGHLSAGDNDLTIEFKNAAGKAVDVGAITMFIDMPGMGSMPPMKSNVKLMTTNTPGIYQATTNLEMAGTWFGHITYKGAAGEGKTDFPIQVK